MKIYLDTCSLHRPLDSKIQIRVALESEAILGILAFCESNNLELISSEALIFEVEQNPNMARQAYALEALSIAKLFVTVNNQIENRAKELNRMGIKPLDALHLACAEEAQADYFCTCDDKILKKAKTIKTIKTKVVGPIELIQEIEK